MERRQPRREQVRIDPGEDFRGQPSGLDFARPAIGLAQGCRRQVQSRRNGAVGGDGVIAVADQADVERFHGAIILPDRGAGANRADATTNASCFVNAFVASASIGRFRLSLRTFV